jgi:hypothetical protein
VALIRNNVSEERIACIIRVESITLVFLRSVLQLLVIANIVPSALILSTLMMQAILSSETCALTGGTRYHVPEDDILRSHLRGNLKSYRMTIYWEINPVTDQSR